MPQIEVKDFFKTLAEKAQVSTKEAQDYLKLVRKKMGVASFEDGWRKDMYGNKLFLLKNAKKLDKFADGGEELFNDMNEIKLYKRVRGYTNVFVDKKNDQNATFWVNICMKRYINVYTVF